MNKTTKNPILLVLLAKGIEATVDESGRRVESVRLPLAPEQWADLANRWGRYLGVCCGAISTIRDALVEALRDDGWIRVPELRSVIIAATDHGGLVPEKRQNRTRNPWGTIVDVWSAVEPYASPEPSETFQKARDPNILADALRIISGLTLQVAVDDVSGPMDVDRDARHYVRSCLHLARLAPALATLHTRFAELWPGDFVGVALVRPENPTRIIETVGGLAVYLKPEDAEDTLGWWERTDKDVRNKVMFRPILVTLDRGLEFADAPEAPDSPASVSP